MDSLFRLLAPHKSASVDRSQKLLDNELHRSQRPNRRLVHEKGGYYLYALIQ